MSTAFLSRTGWTTFYGGIILMLLSLSACGTDDTDQDSAISVSTKSVSLDVPAEGTAYLPTLDGPLRAISATPNGTMLSLRPGQVLAVTFSQPMVPLGDPGTPSSSMLRISPKVEGTLHWEGTQTLIFEPTAPLPIATAFNVEVVSGLTALSGSTLEDPITWTFETPRPALVKSIPAQGASYVNPSDSLRLYFNQRIDFADAFPYLRLTTDDEKRQVISFTNEAEGDSALILAPVRPLERGTAYRLTLREALPAADGPLGLREDIEISFRTFGPLNLIEVDQPIPWWMDVPEAFDPQRGIRLQFSNPVRFGDLRNALTFAPVVPFPPGLEAQDEQVSESHVIRIPWSPKTDYTLTISNLTDIFDQTLPSASTTFSTGTLPPSLSMPQGFLVVEADQQPILPLRVTNIERVQLGARPLRADEIIPALRAYDFSHYYGSYSEDQEEPAPIEANRSLSLNLPADRPDTFPLHFDSLLTEGTGVVAVRLTAPNRPEWGEGRDLRAIAQFTRMGITAKFSPHENLIFVTDLQTATPVGGATVTIRDVENRVRWEGTTDAEGRALSPGWHRLGMEPENEWERPVQYAFVERGADLAFTSSVHQDGLEPYRFDVDFAWYPEAETHAGSVFTDRGLYRTGESMYLKGILRKHTSEDWEMVSDSIRVLFQSPRDQIVLNRVLAPSDLGTFDLEWAVPPQADQGVYSVRVALANDTLAATRSPYEQGDLARGMFRVDAFRTATFSVEATTTANSYVAGDFFEGTIEGRYLFGGTMAGQPVRYYLSRVSGSYAPPGLDGYRFGTLGNYYYRGPSVYRSLASADTVLDEEGRIHVNLQLPGNEQGVPTLLNWEGNVTDPARQELSGRRQITLHPGRFYIGLRPETTFMDLQDDNHLTVDVATVDPDGQQVEAKTVTVEVIRQQWNSVREVGVDGRLRWRSERTEEITGTQTVQTEPGKARRLTLTIRQGGSYLIRATGTDLRGNTIRSEAYFYATGEGYVAWERADDDRINLVADKTTYQPGETARIMVQSPFETATALITIEREGILSSRVETLEGSAPQIEIPLSETHLPNAFVSVILLNGRTAEPSATQDAGAPAFKIGYTRLRVDPGARHLRVEVTPNAESYRPGEEVTVQLQLLTDDGKGKQGEIAFAAADAGVLNLIGYTLPDPFDAFYGPRPLRVTTTEARSNLVKQRNFGQKEEDEGGGGGDADFLLRQDFRPLAHWAPAIRTDERGRASLTFKLPESLTTFRLMATALTADHYFGAAHKDVLVTQPLIMQPALPRFTRLNDTFEAGVLVSNQTDMPGEASVSAEAEGLALLGPALQEVSLEAGETHEVRFQWRVDQVGEARLSFSAVMGEERDALVTSVPVLRPITKNTTATFASTDDAAQEILRLPEGRVPGLSRFEASLSSTALVGLDGAAQYLFDYPYGCLEQRTSRIRPLLLADDLLETFDLQALDGDRHALIQEWLRDLDEFWNYDGFSLWPGSRHTNPYVSAYVVLALAEAEAAGFEIPSLLTSQAVDALATHVRNRGNRPEYYSQGVWNDTRALMLFALARHGRILDGEIRTLADALLAAPGTSSEGLSLLLRTTLLAQGQALQSLRTPLADRLKERMRIEATTAYLAAPQAPEYAWIFASDIRSTAFGLTALTEADDSEETRLAAQRMVRYLMNSRHAGHWSSTQENAAVIDGFRAFYEVFESTEPDFTAEVRVAGNSLLRESFRGRSLRTARVQVPADSIAKARENPIEITTSGSGTLYYTLRTASYSTAPQTAASQGLRLARQMQRLDRSGQATGAAMTTGDATITLRAGDLVRVTLKLTSPTDRNFVVVDDALPAGLEALNTAFDITPGGIAAQTGNDRWWGSFNHTEIRNDRVLLFADYLQRGEHTYTYVARATTPGTFLHPPVQGELMYQPEVNGRNATGILEVQVPVSTAMQTP